HADFLSDGPIFSCAFVRPYSGARAALVWGVDPLPSAAMIPRPAPVAEVVDAPDSKSEISEALFLFPFLHQYVTGTSAREMVLHTSYALWYLDTVWAQRWNPTNSWAESSISIGEIG